MADLQAPSCPHCNGESGYFSDIVFKAVRSIRWDGSGADTENYTVQSETNHRCADCGKSVRAHLKRIGVIKEYK